MTADDTNCFNLLDLYSRRYDACFPAEMFVNVSDLMRVFDLSPGLTIASEISTIRNLNLTCLAARLKIAGIL
jgi:hypothetical protein